MTPLVSVITNIACDHMQYLGETIEQIALEKCGIIKSGVPVVTSARHEAALRVIRRIASEQGCALTEVTEPVDYEQPLVGEHQHWNCATVVAALKTTGLKISEDQLRDGLRRTDWPGRFQMIDGRPPVVLDGAHNAAAAADLAAALRRQFPGMRFTLILGVLRDKDYAAIAAILAPLVTRAFCVPVNSDRTSDPAELARLCRQANPSIGVTAVDSLPAAYAEAINRNDPVVITGSLFLVGEALAKLGLPHPRPAACARELVLQ